MQGYLYRKDKDLNMLLVYLNAANSDRVGDYFGPLT